MITPAEMDNKLHPLETEFWKVIDSKDPALILNWVIHSIDFAENLIEISCSSRSDIEYTKYERDELRAAFVAVRGSKMHLTTALVERVRKEKQ